jgi:hypothetical protein
MKYATLFRIDEVYFVVTGGFSFRRFSSHQQGIQIVKPKLCHPVVVRRASVAGDRNAMALRPLSQVGNASSNGTVDIFPVVKKLLIR